MKRMALIGAVLLAAGLTWAEPPSDAWTLDYRTKGKQFELRTKRGSTPKIVASLMQGTNAWPATGWTVNLRYWRSDRSEAMVTIPGTVDGSTVTFQGATNDFGTELAEGYGAIVASSNAWVVSFAEGVVNVQPGPEIGTTNQPRPRVAIYGPDFGPFTGDFSGWPFGGGSGEYAAQAGHATNADVAVNAEFATEAEWSEWAGNATNAEFATTAGYAAEAGHATNADVAASATTATTATTASNANKLGGHSISDFMGTGLTSPDGTLLIMTAPGGPGQVPTATFQALYAPQAGHATNADAAASADDADTLDGHHWSEVASVTNGLVTAAVTGGLYSASNPAGYVTETVTNGLASTSWVTGLGYATNAGAAGAGVYVQSNNTWVSYAGALSNVLDRGFVAKRTGLALGYYQSFTLPPLSDSTFAHAPSWGVEFIDLVADAPSQQRRSWLYGSAGSLMHKCWYEDTGFAVGDYVFDATIWDSANFVAGTQYLAPDGDGSALTGDVLHEAPTDDVLYGRLNGAWEAVPAGGGDVFLARTNVFTASSNSFAGAISVGGNLTVSGATTHTGVTTNNGAVQFNGTLTATNTSIYGSLGINTNNASPTYPLYVSGSGISLKSYSSAVSPSWSIMNDIGGESIVQMGRSGNSVTSNKLVFNNGSGGGFIFGTTANNVGINNTTLGYLLTMEPSGGGYYSSSDHQWHNGSSASIKTNVQTMATNALAQVLALRPVTYDCKSSGAKTAGFIAEEVALVIPTAVDMRADGVADGLTLQPIVAALVTAVQEQQKRIAKLEDRVAALEKAGLPVPPK